MKILLTPDKYKGSLIANQVCESWEKGIKGCFPAAEILKQPMADGGEGSLEIIRNQYNLKPIKVKVKDPLGRIIKAKFLMNNKAAFIEMAEASGLTLLDKSEKNPWFTSTYGTGQLIQLAIERGATVIYLLLGGSATQDAGLGMAQALGFQFIDFNGETVEPIPMNFHLIQKVKDSQVLGTLKNVHFHIITDVNNLLCGPEGSTYTYALQKGANVDDLPLLEERMLHIGNILDQYFGQSVSKIKGSGAAGGMGAGALALLGGKIQSGFDFLSKVVCLESLINECDIVFTGEGRADLSSLHGKVVGKVAELTHQHCKKLVVITGTVLHQQEILLTLKPDFFATIDSLEPDKSIAIQHASIYLEQLAKQAIKSLIPL